MDYQTKSEICSSWLSLVWHYEKSTGVYAPEPNQHTKILNINSYGFRGPEFSINKNENIFRIFMIGGSTTVSLRSDSDNHTIPGYLQTMFNDNNYKQIEIINAGVPGITSTDELALLKYKILNFNPDLIIIYDGANDITYSYNYKPEKGSLRDTLADVFNRYLPFWETPVVIYRTISTSQEKQIIFDQSDTERKVELWKKNIQEICDIGVKNHFKTLIILQPILGSGNKTLTQYEKINFAKFDQSKVVSSYGKFALELDELNQSCTKAKDFRDIFDNEQNSVYFDNVHVGIDSDHIVAERIYTILNEMI